MKRVDIKAELQGNTYPGRGIMIGKHAHKNCAVVAYFIMGRSENSKNRIFMQEGKGLKTKAFDESKLTDPSLIIYAPVRVLDNQLIVTNGDQTDTIYEHLKTGESFETALRTRTFEPDPPNFTPRISGLLEFADGDFSYKLSILKSANGNENSAWRFFYEYETPQRGEGHFLHTYEQDGDPIPSFSGEPKGIAIDGEIDAFTQLLWENLNENNKVALFTRFVDLDSLQEETRIINKLG